MANNKSLGRGLSAFLNTTSVTSESNDDLLKIKIDRIVLNPYQPRQTFDEEQLQALASSIKRKGVLQPILVIKTGEDFYQLVAGERRLRASKLAGLLEIPAVIADFSPEDQLEVAILENIQRENLNPIDEAEGYRRLINEFNHTQEELSEMMGKSRSHIANILRLLSLPSDVKQLIQRGDLSFGHARALVSAENPSELAQEVLKQSLNVRETEKLVQQSKNPPVEELLQVMPSINVIGGPNISNPESVAPSYANVNDLNRIRDRIITGNASASTKTNQYIDPEIQNISAQIGHLTGLSTVVRLKGNGGKIELTFENLEQLDAFIQRLNR